MIVAPLSRCSARLVSALLPHATLLGGLGTNLAFEINRGRAGEEGLVIGLLRSIGAHGGEHRDGAPNSNWCMVSRQKHVFGVTYSVFVDPSVACAGLSSRGR